MPTVIQNWCTYKIVKTYHCWCEYEYAPPAPSYDPFIDLLVVGGGWDGWKSNAYTWWWGWWGGWVIVCEALSLDKQCSSYNVCAWCKWQNSCFNDIIACRWGNWGFYQYGCWQWYNGWSGWGSVLPNCIPWDWIDWQWNDGWKWSWDKNSSYAWWWGGGWWAWSAWCNTSALNWWNWGDAIINCFSWEAVYYWWWWWGWVWVNGSLQYWTIWTAWCWWWNWGGCNAVWCNATWYWWWWGGGGWYTAYCRNWWNWYQWVVILRYKTDWTCWILPSSTWWCQYTCWEWTIHCFCNAWCLETFNPVYN